MKALERCSNFIKNCKSNKKFPGCYPKRQGNRYRKKSKNHKSDKTLDL